MTLSRIIQSFATYTTRLITLTTVLGAAGMALAAPPPVIVGRIVAVDGNVRYFDDFSGEWRPVLLNQIIAQGEHLNSDAHARLALRIGSTSVWLDERADLQVGQVGDEALLLRLRRGAIALRLRSSDLAPLTRIQTRQGWILPESEGLYRVEQRPQATRVLTLQGRLRFEPTQAIDLQTNWMRDGEQMEFDGARAESMVPAPDPFSDWVGAQIYAESNQAAGNYRYVAPEVTLSDDLMRYGQWDQWHGRWGWLQGSALPPPIYLRVYPHTPRHHERTWDRPAYPRGHAWGRDADRDRPRDRPIAIPAPRPERLPDLSEPHRPRPVVPAGNPSGERPDRTAHSPPGGNLPPAVHAPPTAPTTPRGPGGFQEKRTPSNPVPDDTEREKRGRRSRDLER